MAKYVYSFGNGTADGDGKMKDTLGGKGAGLAEMCRAKLPVPPGFTISTQVCNIYFDNKFTVPAEIDEQMLDAQYRYHVLDAPTIDDGLYDAGIRELNSLEEQFPDLLWRG